MSVILSYGMGVDSTAAFLRWLEEPDCRNFDLSDLIVITAMVGDEFDTTGQLVADHILPRMAERDIRFVQLARGGLLEKNGVVVLDDSTSPDELWFDGVYKLSDEMKAAGTIPMTGGTRKCSLKYKGFVIDTWLKANIEGPYRHVIGFNAEEQRRIDKDQVYGQADSRQAEYPLMEWGWGRQACMDYIKQVTGVDWRKSACVFCPFSRGKEECICRYWEEPENAADALELEHVALSFNPRMKLFNTRSAREMVGEDHPALRIMEKNLRHKPWAIYSLTRGMKAKKGDMTKRGATQRSIEKLAGPMTAEEAVRALSVTAASEKIEQTDPFRLVLRHTGDVYPRIEEYLVAAPDYVGTKHGRWGKKVFNRFLAEVESEIDW